PYGHLRHRRERAAHRRGDPGRNGAPLRQRQLRAVSRMPRGSPERKMDDQLQAEQARWEEETLQPALEEFPERKERFTTGSGIPVERLYLPAHDDREYLERLGFPGEYPFTRGVQPTMYRGRLWTMRQYAGFGTAAESNARYHYLLRQGQTGLSVAFDLPTQIGYDADDPMAAGEVGRVGVSISSLEDMRVLLDGIPLEQVSISM